MLKVLELFAGIGACSKALERLGIPHKIVDAVEIDKYAIKSFNAIHGTDFAPQDISQWDKDLEVDLIMHGSPCQDFSVAGKQAGGDEGSGTRSSLMYETIRIVEKLKPKYVIWENVKNLLSKKHRHNFDAYLKSMEDLGYHNEYKVLNAKDYGIPQNRERVFTVSIRKDLEAEFMNFRFPEPIELKTKLKDILEPVVDEKFYLSDEQVASFKASTAKAQAKGNGFKFEPLEIERESAIAHTIATRAGSRQTDNFIKGTIRLGGLYDKNGQKHQAGSVYGPRGVAATLSTMQGGNQEPIIVASRGRNPENPSDRSVGKKLEQRLEPNRQGITNTITSVTKDNYLAEPIGGLAIRTANKQGYDIAINGDGIDLAYPQSKTRRGRVGHGVSKTLMGMDSMGTLDNYRIRKLTPKECWRLMGFADEDFEKAKSAGVSNSQLYKQAGNSIVVNVLEGILRNLLLNQ